MFSKLFKTDKKIIESIQFKVLEIIKVEFLNSAIVFNIEIRGDRCILGSVPDCLEDNSSNRRFLFCYVFDQIDIRNFT